MSNPFGTESDPPTLAPGSFWAVPANDEHVTACLTPQSECRFFFHADAAFDFTPIDALAEERTAEASAIPVNELNFASLDPYNGSATVWGDPATGAHGMMIRIDAGEDTGDLAHRNTFTLVPVTGNLSIESDDQRETVGVRSLLEVEANTPHALSCSNATDCLFYLFSNAALEINHN